VTFAVLNPGGRDPDIDFSGGVGTPDLPQHAPVNFHAFAACSRGGFFRSVRSVPEKTSVVLLLLRKRNLRQALEALQTLRARGSKVFVTCKESGSHQVAELLGDTTRLELFSTLCASSNGGLATTTGLVPLLRACGCPVVHQIPTPYPVDLPAWDFSSPFEKRRGIFVGTREFAVPSRNHLAAVVLADEMSRALDCPLAVMNTEGRRGGMILKSLRRKNPLLFIIEAPLPYPDYLRVMTLHRIVWQLDSSHVPGQVAGDALLCRMPCVGGNGEVDRVAFGGGGENTESAWLRARELLQNDHTWHKAVDESQARALEHLSFEQGARRLAELGAA
jgi:hypothetical protein